MSDPPNIYAYETRAAELLPDGVYDYIAGGATDEITLRRTRAILDSIMLRPRVLVDIDQPDLSTTVLGHRTSFPVLLAPAGFHGRAHPDAELATARAAATAGTVMMLGAGSTVPLEDVAQAAAGTRWFQQYLFEDERLTLAMAERAEAAGYTALCLTLDAAVKPKRERNLRNDYVDPESAKYTGLGKLDRTATWSSLDRLARHTSLPLMVKGIMTAEDAKECVAHGVRAIVVSNHGARQLDTTFTTLEVLPEVVAAVDGACEVYLDGGIRRGTDVLKALALGARAVMIGRPVFWGLAVAGEAGVLRILEILRDELETAMLMCGRPTIPGIDRSVVGLESPLLRLLGAQ